MRGFCSICNRHRPLPYETPVEPPFFAGGSHCDSCDQWLRVGVVVASGSPFNDGVAR